MVNDHSDSERGDPLPSHRLFFPISSKGFSGVTDFFFLGGGGGGKKGWARRSSGGAKRTASQ